MALQRHSSLASWQFNGAAHERGGGSQTPSHPAAKTCRARVPTGSAACARVSWRMGASELSRFRAYSLAGLGEEVRHGAILGPPRGYSNAFGHRGGGAKVGAGRKCAAEIERQKDAAKGRGQGTHSFSRAISGASVQCRCEGGSGIGRSQANVGRCGLADASEVKNGAVGNGGTSKTAETAATVAAKLKRIDDPVNAASETDYGDVEERQTEGRAGTLKPKWRSR